jgi:hypothetical protein
MAKLHLHPLDVEVSLTDEAREKLERFAPQVNTADALSQLRADLDLVMCFVARHHAFHEWAMHERGDPPEFESVEAAREHLEEH